jgi:hypothetical protein
MDAGVDTQDVDGGRCLSHLEHGGQLDRVERTDRFDRAAPRGARLYPLGNLENVSVGNTPDPNAPEFGALDGRIYSLLLPKLRFDLTTRVYNVIL